MKKLLLHFALAAVMLLGATVTASAEKVTENLSAVNKTCSIRVYKDLSEASPSYKGYITGTVIAMPTSSVPGLLSVSNLTTTQGLAGTNVSGDIDIPAMITDANGRKFIVREIAESAFKDHKQLTSVNFTFESSDSYSSFSSYKAEFIIRSYAFQGCTSLRYFSLTTSKCPFSVGIRTVFTLAFDGCTALTQWLVPMAEGYNVGSGAFRNCSSMTSLRVAGSFYDDAFEGCTGVKNLYWYGISGLDYTQKRSGNNPFESMKSTVQSITLYSSVPMELFKDFTALISVETPADIWDHLSNTTKEQMGIGKDAFSGCSKLKSISVAGFIHWRAFRFCSKVTSVIYRGGFYNYASEPTDVSTGFFSSIADVVTSFKIESTSTQVVPTKYLPNYICGYMTNLTSVTIPNYVTSIGTGAFYGCESLTSITLPSSIRYIYEDAFYGCTKLTTCPISATHTNLKTIGKEAFGMTSINSFYVPQSVTSMGGLLLNGCTKVKEILFYTTSVTRAAVGGSYANLFFTQSSTGRQNIEKFYISPDLNVIPDSLFYNFGGLQRLTDKNGLTELSSIKSVGSAAFYGCTSLWDSYGPNKFPNLTEVETSAFEASNFPGFELPALKTIGKRGFANTKLMYLHDLGAMANLTTIGEEAFADNAKLSIATFAGVQTIGARAFANDAKLETINVSKVVPTIQSNSFTGCNVKTIKGSCTIISELQSNANWKAVCSNISAADNNYKYPSNMDNFWCTKSTMEIVQDLDCEGVFVVKAVPYEGCTFLYWNDGNTDNPRTFNLNEYTDSWLYAIAASDEDFHTTNFTVQPEGAGYLEITNQYGHNRNNQRFPMGEMAKLTPKELNGWYEFNDWDYQTGDMMEAPYICDIETAPTTLCVSINYTFDAGGGEEGGYTDPETGEWIPGSPVEPELKPMFDENLKAQFTLKPIPVTVEMCTDGNGMVEIDDVHQLLGNDITLTAVANEGYVFDQWEDGNKEATREVTITPEMLIERQPMGWDPELGDMTYNEYPVNMGGGSLENYHSESEYMLRLCAKFKVTTGINDVQSGKVQCTKVLRDGVLYIMYNGTMYNAQGQRVK